LNVIFSLGENVDSSAGAGSVFDPIFDRDRRYIAVAVLASLIAIVLLFEFFWKSAADLARFQNNAARLEIKSVMPAMHTGIPLQSAVRNWASIAAARPLFSANRSPFRQVTQAPALTMSMPRLAGIIVTSRSKIGIFTSADGASIMVREDESIGPFKLLSIATDDVRLSGASGIITLRPSYEPNPMARDVIPPAGDRSDPAFTGTNTWPIPLEINRN